MLVKVSPSNFRDPSCNSSVTAVKVLSTVGIPCPCYRRSSTQSTSCEVYAQYSRSDLGGNVSSIFISPNPFIQELRQSYVRLFFARWPQASESGLLLL